MPGTLTCLGVPIDSVGSSGGTELAPSVLRRRLVGLPMVEGGDTHNRLRGGRRDPTTGWIDFDAVVAMTGEVRRRVASLARRDRPLLVLGGCCTLVPAVLAGLRDSTDEPVGLAYLDGHMDLYEGSTSPTGEGADMPLATALGRAPERLLRELGAASDAPLLKPDDLCLIGPRDRDEREQIGDPADWGIEWFRDRDALRGADLAAVGERAGRYLAGRGKYWLALDVDILDEREFPATDYLMPNGLAFSELEALIRPLLHSPALAGLSITCFNPEKDPDGRCGTTLASLLTDLLT